VFIGNGGAEYDVRGYVAAYDAENGKEVWRWYAVPGDPSKGFEDKSQEKAAKPGMANGGSSAAGHDLGRPQLRSQDQHDLFRHRQRPVVGAGNPQPRRRRQPYVSSIVALEADTGEYKWHYQETPGDEWDYDNCNPLIVADLKMKDGKMHHVVMQAPKQGFFYILEAKTGKLLSADKYVPETNWATHVDMKTGRPVEDPKVRYSKERQAGDRHPGGAGITGIRWPTAR
jgi:glucose dehydrogenase